MHTLIVVIAGLRGLRTPTGMVVTTRIVPVILHNLMQCIYERSFCHINVATVYTVW